MLFFVIILASFYILDLHGDKENEALRNFDFLRKEDDHGTSKGLFIKCLASIISISKLKVAIMGSQDLLLPQSRIYEYKI